MAGSTSTLITYGSGDLTLKRPREEEENGASAVASMETETAKKPESISSVIPGWLFEISPMCPAEALIEDREEFVSTEI